VRGGRTRRHSAQGVVEVVGEGLERQSMVAQRWRIWWGRSGEVVKEEEKGATWWGVAPFIATRGGGRWRRGDGNRWAGKRRQRRCGHGKVVVWPLSEGGQRSLDAVGP
jgi:hypothetical protein